MLILQPRNPERNRHDLCQERRKNILFLHKQMRKKPDTAKQKTKRDQMGDKKTKNPKPIREKKGGLTK